MDYDQGKDEDGSKKQAAELPIPPLPNPPLQEKLYEKRLAKLLSDLKAVEEKCYRRELAEHCSAQRVIPISDGEEEDEQSDEPVIVFEASMREVFERLAESVCAKKYDDKEEGVQQIDQPSSAVEDPLIVFERVLQNGQRQSDDEVGDSQGDQNDPCVHCDADGFITSMISGKLGGVLALALSVVILIIIHRFGMA